MSETRLRQHLSMLLQDKDTYKWLRSGEIWRLYTVCSEPWLKALVTLGACTSATDKVGTIPAEYAGRNNHQDVVCVLSICGVHHSLSVGSPNFSNSIQTRNG